MHTHRSVRSLGTSTKLRSDGRTTGGTGFVRAAPNDPRSGTGLMGRGWGKSLPGNECLPGTSEHKGNRRCPAPAKDSRPSRAEPQKLGFQTPDRAEGLDRDKVGELPPSLLKHTPERTSRGFSCPRSNPLKPNYHF